MGVLVMVLQGLHCTEFVTLEDSLKQEVCQGVAVISLLLINN